MRRAHPLERVSLFLAVTVAVGVPVVFLTIFFLYPTASLILRGFVNEAGQWDLSGFPEVLAKPRVWRAIRFTISLSTLATLISLLLAVPGAWVLYRLSFPGRSLIRGLVAVPFVLPSVVVGVAFRTLFAEGGLLNFLALDGTATAVVIGMVFFNYSLAVRTIGNLWVRLDPRMEEAARTLGGTTGRVFFTVTLPRLLPAISAAGALIFLFCATSFALVLILSGTSISTVETEIYFLTTGLLDLRSAAVLSIVQLGVIGLSLWVVKRAQAYAAKTQKLRVDVPARPVSKNDLPAVAFTAIVVGVLLLLPLGNLILASLHRKGQWTFSNYTDLFAANAVRVLKEPAIYALGRSLLIAFVAMLIALLVGVLVAIVLSRRPRQKILNWGLSGLDVLFALPLGVSAVTVGFGFLIALDEPPLDFRSSWWLVPLAQAMVAVPLVVRIVTPVLEQIDRRQLEVAQVLGASWMRVLTAVEFPLVSRSIVLAAAFSSAMSLGEFGATSFVARSAEPTLPLVIYRLVSKPGAAEQGMALAASVILALVAAGLLVAAEAWFDRSHPHSPSPERNTPISFPRSLSSQSERKVKGE
ncbi:iron ABC transporter permease [Gleimia sp. 6138-11-ORH1]|uniref:ABC transporter permease n=1 Tax=Gleimia sp. 6138-11-ORH1 TaxID=2973937 RepID=UPI002169F77E|nr:iron ABC transporter permease [Gleimia sp. 6138-11-ORH1]MCS4484996.1 iron ABC transporter permease [Gleimia sp. 6138-11-ORH1]